jgi:PAS domain S-box-containing protein
MVELGKLLVVDDEPQLMGVLCDQLQRQGYTAVGVSSANEAVKALHSREFDVLITDLVMPEMDGISLLRRALELDSNLVPLLMTGQGTIQSAVEAMQQGAFDYILKPFKIRAILPILDRAMSIRRLRLENVALHESLALYELGQAIMYVRDLSTILDKVVDAALNQCKADEASLMLPTEDGRQFYVAAIRGSRREHLLGIRVSAEESIAGYVARNREPFRVEGEPKDLPFKPVYSRRDLQSAISYPLISGGGLIGVLNVSACKQPGFSLGQMKGLGILAAIAASAIQEAQLREELARSEARFRSLIESAPDSIVIVNDEGTITLVNSRTEELFGYTRDELLEKPLEILIPGLLREKHLSFRDEFMKHPRTEGMASEVELVGRRLNGNEVPLEITFNPCKTESGLLAIAVVRDISARKRSEEALRLNDELLQSVMNNSSAVIYIKDMDARYLRINKRFEDLFHVTNESVCGKTAGDFFPAELTEGWNKREREVIQQRRGIQWEETVPHEDGPHNYISIQFPLLNSDGAPWALCGISTDVTELKRSESERQRLGHVVEQASEGVVIADLKGEISYVNPAMAEMSGYGQGECSNLWSLLFGTEAEQDAHKLIRLTIDASGVWTGAVRCKRRDGSFYDFFASITKVFDGDDGTSCLALIGNDMTRERAVEARLRQSQRLEALGTLAGGIAHDFNNVLSAIQGYTQMCRDASAPDTAIHTDLGEVLRASQRARDLIQQILTFSRKQDVVRGAVSLPSIAKEALRMLRATIPATVEFSEQIEESSGPVYGDPTQIHQVVMNLCTNASQAMTERGGVLEVVVETVAFDHDSENRPEGLEDGTWVRLSVSDTGCGMDRATLDRVFDPFFTTKGPGEGTGLGLSTAHGIVQSHGGLITAWSEPGRGSRFDVYLRCREVSVNSEVLGEFRTMGAGQRILVVDDEEAIATLLKRALTMRGFLVEATVRSVSAFQLLRSDPQAFDLLLTDLTMPQVTGIELAEMAKTLRADLPVILMSGYVDEDDPELAQSTVVDAIVRKPANMDAIAKTIRETLEKKNALR